jgi:hypothetical protein
MYRLSALPRHRKYPLQISHHINGKIQAPTIATRYLCRRPEQSHHELNNHLHKSLPRANQKTKCRTVPLR